MFISSARRLTAAALGMGLVLSAAACGGDDAGPGPSAHDPDNKYAGSGNVVFSGFGGDTQDAQTQAWLDPFEQASGITVRQDNPTSYTKVQQMVKANHVLWDVFDGGADFPGGVAGNNPDIAEIDCSIVDCADFTGPYKAQPQAVPSYIYSYVLGYSTEMFGDNPPTVLQDLWNTEEYPGTRMIDASWGFLGLLDAAHLQSGASRDELYPIDIDAAFAELDKIKDSLVFYTDNQECANAVGNGDAVMGVCMNGRVTMAKESGLPVDIAWGRQVQAPASLLIPRNSPNPENAQKLIGWITSAEQNGKISEFSPYSPANPKAVPQGKYADDVPTNNELPGDQAPIHADLVWWGENASTLYQRVANWTSN